MSKKLDGLLDFWAEHHMNVMLEGAHGFGKTAMVKAAFERKGWKHKYFSASTMDPWVDLVGVPKEHTDENGNTYLNLVRPKEFQNDEYDAIFFDEFNRAPKKVRNAVMELIQFKSVNGHEFKNLKVVWVAINPHDEEETYDVEKLDPAQYDRFHVHYIVPNQPDRDFFVEKYGRDNAVAAIDWWNALPEKIQSQVSGRRLEYALDCFLIGGDIKYLLPAGSNPSKLIMTLKAGSAVEVIKKLVKANDTDGITNFLKLDNNFEVVVGLLKYEPELIDRLVPLMEEERLMRLIVENVKVRDFIMDPDVIDKYRDMVSNVIAAGGLSEREAIRLKSLLNKNTVELPKGITVFEPDSDNATVSPDIAVKRIEKFATACPSATPDELKDMYDFLSINLPAPKHAADIIATLTVLYFIIEKVNHDRIIKDFVGVIPMLNYVMTKMEEFGMDINSKSVKYLYGSGRFKLNKTRVQGFLDTYYDSLVIKPRLI